MLMNLDHDTLIRSSHESPVVYFVCRSFSLLKVQGCQTVSGSRLFVAERSHSYACYGATACFDTGYNHVMMNVINAKKVQFIHTVNGDGSKTAKIIKRQC